MADGTKPDMAGGQCKRKCKPKGGESLSTRTPTKETENANGSLTTFTLETILRE